MRNIGDIFEDGGFKYEVIGKHELGYAISKRIGKADTKVEPIKVEPVKEEKPYTKTEINRLSTASLEKVCGELGLEIGSGVEMKKAIIKKLEL